MKKAVKRKSSAKKVVKKTSARGLSKVLLLVIVAVVIVAGGGFYFMNQSGGGLPLVRTPLNPNCELNDPELCKFMNNWKEMKNYTVTSVMEGAEGSMESMYEMTGDRFHMMSKMDGKENYNMISIGNTSYTKDYTDNTWVKYTYEETDEDSSVEDLKDSFTFADSEEAEDKTEYKFIGKEACGELMCFKYEIVDPNFEGKQFIWFDDREYLLRKQRTEDAGTSTESTFAYNPVTISEPSPVKEGTPADAMGAPAMSAEDQAAYKKMMEEYQQSAESMQDDYSAPEETYVEE